ncbi:hypothetical protein ILUMI_20104, partial [Ignelater luminosus]
MFPFLLISILACASSCIAQSTDYDINEFQKITCFSMMSVKQIRDGISSTLMQHNSIPRVIEFLEIDQWDLSHFSIASLKFLLPELKQITTYNSNIKKLSYDEEANELYMNTTFAETSSAESPN